VKAYVVTENEFDKELLESLLARHFGRRSREVRVWSAGSKHHAWTGACSLLPEKRLPTAIIVDADTIDDDLTEDQQVDYEYLLGTSAHRSMWVLIMAKPEVEAVFFSDRALLERATGKKVSELDVARAALCPRAALQKLLPKPRSGHGAKQMVKKLSESDLEYVLSSEAFRPLIEFLERHLSPDKPSPGPPHRGGSRTISP
jgi:hypothetical protein